MDKYLLIICFLSLFNGMPYCQSSDDDYYYHSHPIDSLPPNVPLIENKVYLRVDTAKTKGKTIQLFIINNTKNEINYDGHELAGIQAEYKINSKNWSRFFPFFYGWCATGYMYQISIPSKEFYVLKEYFRDGKIKSEIRFTFVGEDVMSSNSFFASIDTSEAELTKYDDLSYRFCDENYLVNIIENMPRPYKEIPVSEKYLRRFNRDSSLVKGFNDDVVSRAMHSLVKRFPARALSVLEPIAENKSHPYQNTAYLILQRIKSKIK